MDFIASHYLICKPLVVYRFYSMVLNHSQTRHHVIKYLLYLIYMCDLQKFLQTGELSKICIPGYLHSLGSRGVLEFGHNQILRDIEIKASLVLSKILYFDLVSIQ